MQSGQRDYILDVYRTLTDIGEQADKTVDSRFSAERTTTVKKTVAPVVKVTPPPLPGAAQPPRLPPVTLASPQSGQSVPSAPPTSLSLRNPFSVVAAAVRAVMQRRAPAFWLGVFFVLGFGLVSAVVIASNLHAERVIAERGPLMPIVLAGVVYLLCWWIRMGNDPRNTPFTGAVRLSDIFAGGTIGLAAAAILPVLRGASGLPLWLKSAANATLWWPLHGPYASMIWPSMIANAPATTFWEPFVHAMLLIAAFPLVPFIIRDRVKRGVKTAHLLVSAPLLILALALCTLPIAVLTATLSHFTLDLVNAQTTFAPVDVKNTFVPSIIMAAIFYAQLVLSGATVGEFYRRVSLSHP